MNLFTKDKRNTVLTLTGHNEEIEDIIYSNQEISGKFN